MPALPKATMEAGGLQTLMTENTGAVGKRERHDYEVALLQGPNLRADVFDNSNCLMAHALSAVLGSP
jgi:hypothetical protein